MFPLDALRTEEFLLAASAISTAHGLHDYLARRPEIAHLRVALKDESVTTRDIEDFVRVLLRDFRPGTRFSGDSVLAVIAVAIESFPGTFADRFLEELSAVRIREIPMAARVASLALEQRRASLADTMWRQFEFQRQDMLHPPPMEERKSARPDIPVIHEDFQFQEAA